MKDHRVQEVSKLPASVTSAILNAPNQKRPILLNDSSMRSVKENISLLNDYSSISFYYDNQIYQLNTQKNHISLP